MDAKLHKVREQTHLILKGEALYDRCIDLPKDHKLFLTFVRGRQKYILHGIVSGTYIKNNEKFTEVFAASYIKEASRRAHPRFNIYVDAKLYAKKDQEPEKLLGTGKTEDICADALRMFCSINLPTEEDAGLSVDFTLFSNYRFRLPVSILNKKMARRSTNFKYAYVLKFDFSEAPEEKINLIFLILQNHIKLQKYEL